METIKEKLSQSQLDQLDFDPQEIEATDSGPLEEPDLSQLQAQGFLFRRLLRVSGLYSWTPKTSLTSPFPSQKLDELNGSERQPAGLWKKRKEELRIDVDGRYPQNIVSGVIKIGLHLRLHWIASVKYRGKSTWSGTIWYKNGNTILLPYTNIKLKVIRSWYSNQRRAIVTFSGMGAASRTMTYKWTSKCFHKVQFEFDVASGTTAVTQINTHAHPVHPESLPDEKLTIKKVFQRAGFKVSQTSDSSIVPLTGSGTNARWSDMEMHDAMQTYWSRFANQPQWSLWTFFAGLHEQGPSLGGIMFDDIGPNHRQGTAIFNDSFIKNPPAGDPSPASWVKRMKFWTVCHEMGHAFNLAHSWQKSLSFNGKGPWIPLADDHEARSFMNYPFRVMGGQSTFFEDFEYRFSDEELLFLRHAPEQFVQMGNAYWFDDHGFSQANINPERSFKLEARLHRDIDYFEFMEPVNIELKLQNVTSQPKLVGASTLSDSEHLTVIIKRKGKSARQWHPYSQKCLENPLTHMAPDQAMYSSLNIGAGLNGWDLAEPGVYGIQVAINIDGEDIISNVLNIKIAPPKNHEEEIVAQDFFSDEVGRILSFRGSMFLEQGNDVLRRVVDQFGKNRVASHASLALATPLTKGYKTLSIPEGETLLASAQQAKGAIKVSKPKVDEARKELMKVLITNRKESIDTLGHIDYGNQVKMLSHFLYTDGDTKAAEECMKNAHDILKSRKVLSSVLTQFRDEQKQYATGKSGNKKATMNN
ncbi:hypothetical protein QQ020_28790 [Fulvivirgaceae bacterium BMA12]|uniref:Peptidase M60 domain-containing protein n=1 Tax=Agaribacillus aureus TaxID=3051825 RepID=A0ABT8LE96_9BACT|nr:hypothetical protein [Fulvivirgaceae bacterium BMA12]